MYVHYIAILKETNHQKKEKRDEVFQKREREETAE